jgi:hypothetical protein
MTRLLSAPVCAFLIVAAVLPGQFGCGKATGDATQQRNSPAMDYEQRQQEVERVRRAIERDRSISPAALRQYTDHKAEELRRDLYALFWRMGTASGEQPVRAAFVEFMLSRTTAETPLLRGQLLKWLQDFRKEDFNSNAVVLLNGLPWNEDYAPAIIRLIGIAEVQQALPRLRAQVAAQPLPRTPPSGFQHGNTWAALLALARLGDDQALATVISRVREERDIVTRASVLLYDLGYTRRPAAFDLLKTYLNSDQRLPRIKDNVPGRLEASHAAAIFSKYVRGFPIQETDFDEQQTLQARAWVNAQTSWQFN